MKVRENKEIQTSSGILIEKDGRFEQAEVLDAGPDAGFKKGDTVFFEDYALITIQDDHGEEVHFVEDDKIIAYAV